MKYSLIAIFSYCIALTIPFGPGLQASEINQAAPQCALVDFNSTNPVNLQQFKGKILYVDFWASWCPPCLRSFPFMNEMSRQYAEQGLEIVAVNLDEDTEDATDFLARSPAHFKVAADTEQQCAKAFDVKAMPSSYLIDRNGTIRHIHLGFKSDETDELRAMITQLLADNQQPQ